MRTHETFETFCSWCLRRFECDTLAAAAQAVTEHERECGKAKAAK